MVIKQKKKKIMILQKILIKSGNIRNYVREADKFERTEKISFKDYNNDGKGENYGETET